MPGCGRLQAGPLLLLCVALLPACRLSWRGAGTSLLASRLSSSGCAVQLVSSACSCCRTTAHPPPAACVQWTQDRGQRAQWLRECLACWSLGPSPDEAALSKLSQLVRSQSAIAPAELVDILQARLAEQTGMTGRQQQIEQATPS